MTDQSQMGSAREPLSDHEGPKPLCRLLPPTVGFAPTAILSLRKLEPRQRPPMPVCVGAGSPLAYGTP